jgi:hypothetical protein
MKRCYNIFKENSSLMLEKCSRCRINKRNFRTDQPHNTIVYKSPMIITGKNQMILCESIYNAYIYVTFYTNILHFLKDHTEKKVICLHNLNSRQCMDVD